MEMERLKCQIANRTKTSRAWSELFKLLIQNPGRKAITIGLVLCMLNHFSGNFVLLNYTANIFKMSGSVLSPNESALVVACVQFIGTCTVQVLVERAGRKVINCILNRSIVRGVFIKSDICFLLLAFVYRINYRINTGARRFSGVYNAEIIEI